MTDSTHDDNLDSLQTHLGPSSAPATPARTMPNFIKFFPPLIQDLFQRGVDITMDPKAGELLLDGFYDNGPLRLSEENDRFKAIDKRNKSTPISNYDDLVMLNFEWWKITNAASKGKKYTPPNRPWLDSFKDKKLVKRSVIYIENDGTGGDETED